jgi:adenylylsulfate kinase
LRQHGTLVEVLDGDEIRRSLSADLGFSAKDRQEHARRVIFLSKLLVRNGINVIVPLISPYRETRELARQELERFIEVYVKCPLEECIRRDVKGLYGRAIRGEITEFTGISDPYEPPESPEVTVETDILSEDECCQLILAAVPELVPEVYSNNGLMTKSVPGQLRSLSERESA